MTERLPNYSVKMGFGLHSGWAIEGPIGSDFKVDASYLSPNVNLASRIGAATKQFGVPMLISGRLYNILTDVTASQFRQIDWVTVKGSIEPVKLFTWDLDLSKLKIVKDKKNNMSKQDLKEQKVQARIERNRYREMAFNNQLQVNNKFELDIDIKTMRQTIPKEFLQEFQKGFSWYISGDWMQAQIHFNQVLKIRMSDNPTKLLLSVMEEYSFTSPDSWKGFRVLTSK